jgi:integrase
VQLARAVIHKALDQALRWDLIVRNPADLVDPPKIERKEFPVLTEEQSQKLLDGSIDDPLHALYAIALTGGQHVSECLGLKWGDVDWEQGTIHIRRQLSRVNGEGIKFADPKTSRGRHAVALPDFAMDTLRQHRNARLEQRLQAEVWEENDLIFCTHVVRHWNGRTSCVGRSNRC